MRHIERALLLAELHDNIVLAQSRRPCVWRPAEAKAYEAARRLVRMADVEAWVQQMAAARAEARTGDDVFGPVRSRSPYMPGTWTGD